MNTFGRHFRVTTFGESHGPALGAVIDGCPAGVTLTETHIQRALDRRRPGQSSLTTPRNEGDRVEILSGVFEEKTLGTPIACIVRNQNQRSADYSALKEVDRPGHADAVWRERYKHRDHRGGGRTSGRETLSRVIGGSIGEAFLERELANFSVVAWVSRVADIEAGQPGMIDRATVDAHPTRCPDAAVNERISARILEAKEKGDSLGGSIDVRVIGVPVGIGEPVFHKLKAVLAGGLASIGAVTGVVWGSPDIDERLQMEGTSFHGDKDVYGGVQGGLANGHPLFLRVLFKPPATLLDHAKGGRHDPCILPRAVPVVESMVSMGLADLYLSFLSLPHRA